VLKTDYFNRMASAGSTSDKTVNKVALCSAIFAGFAYVGYSVVRTAFHRRRREGERKIGFMNEFYGVCVGRKIN